MLMMPASFALLRHAEPDLESRLTIINTLTFSLIMLSHSWPNLATSPSAFWMSASMPASENAFSRLGRSCASHRGDVVVSGRITPTLPDASPLPPSLPLPPLSLSPHAARAPNASTPAATRDAYRAPLFLTIPRPPWLGPVRPTVL